MGDSALRLLCSLTSGEGDAIRVGSGVRGYTEREICYQPLETTLGANGRDEYSERGTTATNSGHRDGGPSRSLPMPNL